GQRRAALPVPRPHRVRPRGVFRLPAARPGERGAGPQGRTEGAALGRGEGRRTVGNERARRDRRSGRPPWGGSMSKGSQYFARKPFERLMEEMQGEGRLRRVLGPVGLTAMGVGAIIGTGIFVLSGQAAAEKAGPAMTLSMVAAGMTCIFAALCYAEFAAMVPVAGSAYTYAYATLGELFAWIIGWDLVLEYAVGASTVAHGWSHYFHDP